MTQQKVEWSQPAMFDGGYEQVTVVLKVHLDGPHGEHSYGWSLEDTVTGAWIAAGVVTEGCGFGDHRWIIGTVERAMKAAYAVLTPF
jgi:hypothetical protein